MAIKMGKIFKGVEETDFNPKEHFAAFDIDFFKNSLKRSGPIKVRKGRSGDDFMHNIYTIVFEARGVRIPRFMNPVRGRRKGKLKNIKPTHA